MSNGLDFTFISQKITQNNSPATINLLHEVIFFLLSISMRCNRTADYTL